MADAENARWPRMHQSFPMRMELPPAMTGMELPPAKGRDRLSERSGERVEHQEPMEAGTSLIGFLMHAPFTGPPGGSVPAFDRPAVFAKASPRQGGPALTVDTP